MRKKLLPITIIGIISLFMQFTSCGSGTGSDTDTIGGQPTHLPLNVSIFLDLSDRVTKESHSMTQIEKDTAIVNTIIDVITNTITKHKIKKANDAIKIFFYPAPSAPNINQLSQKLDVDFSKIDKTRKKYELLNLKASFDSTLTQIYNQTIIDKAYIGSDIWGFFKNGKAEDLCIRPNYRNVLVILSDGYIFHKNNKIKEGNNYSYILSQTLSNPNSGLIPCPEVPELEVLFLEINPQQPTDYAKMVQILENWFKGMNVKKLKLSDTDLPNNTRRIIENFME